MSSPISPAVPRARLRGGASHEAKGRRGARGGGAGRVGPPATRRRLCVLRQIGDQLVPGLEQFLFVDDVVAVEDGAGLVAGQEHGDALGDTGADQVAGGGAAAIVEEAGRHASRLAGGAPRRAPAADGDAVAVEDQRAVGVAARPPSREGLGNGLRDRENSPHQRLRAGGREPDDAAGLVKFVPGEAEDLVLAPAGVVGEVEDVLPRGGQVGADGEGRCCMNTRCGWGGVARTSRDTPQEPARYAEAAVRTDIGDGTQTAVVGELEPGSLVVTGVLTGTAAAATTASSPLLPTGRRGGLR